MLCLRVGGEGRAYQALVHSRKRIAVGEMCEDLFTVELISYLKTLVIIRAFENDSTVFRMTELSCNSS